MAALSVALAARRRALLRLTARTSALGKGAVNRLYSPSTVSAALGAHGALEHFDLAHVLTFHRRTLTESASTAIDATAPYRKQPAPAVPAALEEIHSWA